MIPISDIRCIHIEITNACNITCANCTRFVGHHKSPFFMSLEMVEKAIDSLEGFPGTIGIMGGEPTIHPQFAEICEMVQRKIPEKRKRQLWSNGCHWDKFEKVIYETFDRNLIIYNDHTRDEDVHQPLLIAADEVVEDEKFMWDLIDKCWIQSRWSASITPKGAFFCEVAAAQDYLFDGPGGYPIEKGWWKKGPDDFKDQVERYCAKCSAAIPMERPRSKSDKDMVSPGNAKRLEDVGSPRYNKGNIEIFDKSFSREEIEAAREDWKPWVHRTVIQEAPMSVDS
jgi:hypothetical protein